MFPKLRSAVSNCSPTIRPSERMVFARQAARQESVTEITRGLKKKIKNKKYRETRKMYRISRDVNCRLMVLFYFFSFLIFGESDGEILETMHACIISGIMQITVFIAALVPLPPPTHLYLSLSQGRGTLGAGVILITAGASRRSAS